MDTRRIVSTFVLAVALIASTAPQSAEAGFVAVAPQLDGPCSFVREFDWFVATPPGLNPWSNAGMAGVHWDVTLTSAPGVIPGTHSFNIDVTHTAGANPGTVPCHPGEGPGLLFPFSFPNLPPSLPPLAWGGAAMQTHAAHVDVVKTAVTMYPFFPVPPIDAHVQVEGIHTTGGDFFASFENQTGGDRLVWIVPTYRGPGGVITPGAPMGPFLVRNGEHRRFPKLPPNAAGTPASDYTLVTAPKSVDGGVRGNTDTTLAYLGDVDGVFTELDLAAATQLFTHNEEFFAPYLVDPVLDVHVAVDLTQWLTSPTPFGMTDVFSFTNGVCDQLPGIYAGTAPFNVAPGTGYVTDEWFTGSLIVAGRVDGSPEPASAGLLLLAVLLLRRGNRCAWRRV